MVIKSNLVEPKSFRLQRLEDIQRKEQEAKQAAIDKANAEEAARQAAAQAEQDRIAAEQAAQARQVEQEQAKTTPAPVAAQVASSGCGDNFYANYIYSHESSCMTHNPNSSGCDGIGQACPASKVIGQCGYDYACQNAWFTQYAIDRYGGWAGAYAFWLNNHWW